jgi:nucleotide-binding universal stress UspA family protein
MSVFTRPLVALSLTEPDVGLLRYVSMLSERESFEEVRFSHVASLPHGADSAAALHMLKERMQAQVCEHFDRPRVRTVCEVVHGPRIDQLMAMAALHHNDVIMLGHRKGRSGQRSLARRLAMVTDSSIWLVPEGSPDRLTNIVVPIDFSVHSADALEVATCIAAAHGIDRCVAVHVFFDPSSVRYAEHLDEIRGREATAFADFVRPINLHGVSVEPVFEESTHPPQALLRVAGRHGADLIVMNTRGRSRAAAILLGSITSKTMEDTTIPVLCVKHFGGRMSFLQALSHRRFWEERAPKAN